MSKPGEKSPVSLFVPDHASDWLQRAWKKAKERGINTMTLEEIDVEINAYRAEQKKP